MKTQKSRRLAAPSYIESLESRTLLSASIGAAMHPDAATPVTHTTLHVSRQSLKLGQPDVLTATVTDAKKFGPVAGSVVFFDDGSPIQTTSGNLTVTLGAKNRASYTFSCGNVALYVGRQSITAEFTSSNSLPNSTSSRSIVNVTIPRLKTATNGLETATVIAGRGKKIAAGQTATVLYTGFLASTGTIFDYATADHGADSSPTFSFTVEASPEQVISGFDQGVVGMKVGETRVLAIPSTLGYGAQGSGSIPANADLVFLVTLQSIS